MQVISHCKSIRKVNFWFSEGKDGEVLRHGHSNTTSDIFASKRLILKLRVRSERNLLFSGCNRQRKWRTSDKERSLDCSLQFLAHARYFVTRGGERRGLIAVHCPWGNFLTSLVFSERKSINWWDTILIGCKIQPRAGIQSQICFLGIVTKQFFSCRKNLLSWHIDFFLAVRKQFLWQEKNTEARKNCCVIMSKKILASEITLTCLSECILARYDYDLGFPWFWDDMIQIHISVESGWNIRSNDSVRNFRCFPVELNVTTALSQESIAKPCANSYKYPQSV